MKITIQLGEGVSYEAAQDEFGDGKIEVQTPRTFYVEDVHDGHGVGVRTARGLFSVYVTDDGELEVHRNGERAWSSADPVAMNVRATSDGELEVRRDGEAGWSRVDGRPSSVGGDAG